MKDAIKKLLGIAQVAAPVAAASQEIIETVTPIIAEAVVDTTADMEALQAQVMTGAKEIERLAAALAEANVALSAIQEAKQELIATAHKAKMEARKAIIEENIGSAKASAFLLATEALDDTAFAAVASALAGSVQFESGTALFKEVGVTAAATPESLPEEKSKEMKILEARYPKQKPATK